MTQGDIKRKEWEERKLREKQQQERERKQRMYESELKANLSGSYKRLVTDAYVSAFGFNYGDDINYDHFDRCFEFRDDKQSGRMIPNFKFNEGGIEFKGDALGEDDFNQNNVRQFITGDTYVTDTILQADSFESAEERESYNEGNAEVKSNDINSDSIEKNNDGMFVALSSENRYSEFNKINKTRGFSTVASVRKSADEQIKKNWESQKNGIIKKMENRRK